MWNNNSTGDGGASGAGFMNTSTQFESPTVAKRERRSQPIAPVTIKMIHDSPEDVLSIAGTEVNMIVVIGIIRSVDLSSTKTTYAIDDSTGVIDGVRWLESDSQMDSDNQRPLMEMTYCQLAGTVRTQLHKKHILIHNIVPLTDAGRLTTHLLEVIHAPLKLLQLQDMRSSNAGPSNPGPYSQGESVQQKAPGQVSAEGNMQGLSGPARVVYQIIKVTLEEVGVHKNEIYGSLKGKVPPPKIDQILEDLSSEGLIFCSVDEDHFKASDS